MVISKIDKAVQDAFIELSAEWDQVPVQFRNRLFVPDLYRRSVSLGLGAVPLILMELRDSWSDTEDCNPYYWFPVLAEMTGANPYLVIPGLHNSLTRNAWLIWGKENGYL